MPKYYDFKVAGYYLYFTSFCVVECMHVHASDSKLTEGGSAKFFVKSNGDTVLQNRGILNDREIAKISDFIKNHYQEMYLRWSQYSENSYYQKWSWIISDLIFDKFPAKSDSEEGWEMMFFENPPTPLPLKGLHLSLYPLSSGEGKNSGLQNPQTFAGSGIAGRRDGFLCMMFDVRCMMEDGWWKRRLWSYGIMGYRNRIKCIWLYNYMSLFIHQGHPNDFLYGAWEENGVCGGNYLMVNGEWLKAYDYNTGFIQHTWQQDF